MRRLCRICMELEGSNKFMKLFNKKHKFAEKLFYVASISVFESSQTLPALICHKCATELTTAARIKKTSLETEDFLKFVSDSNDIKLLNDLIEEPQEQLDDIKQLIEEPQEPLDDIIEEYLDDFEPDPPLIKPPRSKINQCDFENCGKVFRKPSDLVNHQYIHFDARNFSCDICGALFKTKGVLYNHKVTHRNIRYSCDKCGKLYAKKNSLTKHLKVQHLKLPAVKMSVCHLCGKALSTSCLLKVHMLYSHEGEKNFKCEICDKAFFTKQKLGQHVDALHGERPWQCEICQRFYSKRYKLSEHMKQTHKMTLAPLKRFICTLCGLTFDRQKMLKDHLRNKHEVVMEEDEVDDDS